MVYTHIALGRSFAPRSKTVAGIPFRMVLMNINVFIHVRKKEMKKEFAVRFPKTIRSEIWRNFLQEIFLHLVKLLDVPVAGKGPPAVLERMSVQDGELSLGCLTDMGEHGL